MIGEHEVAGGGNDERHDEGRQEAPHHLPVHSGTVACTENCNINQVEYKQI
jgi:hypothetical protein